MKNLILILFLVLSLNTYSQTSVDSVLANIERNNTTLLALQKSIVAEKTGNKTGLLPVNPEIEFNYLWGNPSALGQRIDFSFRQSFDFPSAYSYRKQISDLKNAQADLEYQKQKREIMFEALTLCVELTWQNALKAEYNARFSHSKQMAETYRKKFETGETNILDYNKAQIYLLNLSKDLENIEIKRQAITSDLNRLNGGSAITFSDSVFTDVQLIPEFEKWYAQVELKNPVLQWLKQELLISQKQKQLQVAQNLPKFNAGYMSEKVIGQQFQGVTLGVSIPLWENINTLKYTRAKAIALEDIQNDSKLQFYNQMKTLHAKTLAMQNSINTYRQGLLQFNNNDLLAKAFNKGEISLGEYLIELTVYYESINKLFEMERSFRLNYCELMKVQ